jgi:uncharacterized protein (TIGR03905 family)
MSGKITHTNIGTCSRSVEFEITEGKIHSVRFEGGCNGNLQGISRLVEGMPIEEVHSRLSGIRCGDNETSCPDQLAKALAECLRHPENA